MVILLYVDKAFNKIHHSFMITVLKKIKDTKDKPQDNKGNLQQDYTEHQLKCRETQMIQLKSLRR